MSFEWFKRELNCMMPNGDLRLVRDPVRLIVDLWVVERRVAPSEREAGLALLESQGEPRYIDITRPDGTVAHWDLAPEWAIAHICANKQFDATDPRYYREPNQSDIEAIRQWLFEFRDFQHSLDTFRREQAEHKEKLDEEANLIIRKELKSSKKFRQLVYSLPDDGVRGTTEKVMSHE